MNHYAFGKHTPLNEEIKSNFTLYLNEVPIPKLEKHDIRYAKCIGEEHFIDIMPTNDIMLNFESNLAIVGMMRIYIELKILFARAFYRGQVGISKIDELYDLYLSNHAIDKIFMEGNILNHAHILLHELGYYG